MGEQECQTHSRQSRACAVTCAGEPLWSCGSPRSPDGRPLPVRDFLIHAVAVRLDADRAAAAVDAIRRRGAVPERPRAVDAGNSSALVDPRLDRSLTRRRRRDAASVVAFALRLHTPLAPTSGAERLLTPVPGVAVRLVARANNRRELVDDPVELDERAEPSSCGDSQAPAAGLGLFGDPPALEIVEHLARPDRRASDATRELGVRDRLSQTRPPGGRSPSSVRSTCGTRGRGGSGAVRRASSGRAGRRR